MSSNNDLLLIPRVDLTKYLDLDEIKSNLELGKLSFTLVNPNHEKEEVGEYFVLVWGHITHFHQHNTEQS